MILKLNYTELIVLVNLAKEECKRAKAAKEECMVKLDDRILEVVAEWKKHPEWTTEQKRSARDTMPRSREEEYKQACYKLALAERLYTKLTKEDYEVEVEENED